MGSEMCIRDSSSFVHVLLAFPAPNAGAPPASVSLALGLARHAAQCPELTKLDVGIHGDGESIDDDDDEEDDTLDADDDDAFAGVASTSASAAPASISLLPSMATTPQPPTLSAPHTSFAAPWRSTPSATEPFAALVHAVPQLTPSIYNLSLIHI